MAIRSSSNTCISCCNLSHFVAFALSALSALSRSSVMSQLEAKSQKWPRFDLTHGCSKNTQKKRPKIIAEYPSQTHRNPSNFRLRIHPKIHQNLSKSLFLVWSSIWSPQLLLNLAHLGMIPDYISNHMAGWDILTNGILMRNQLQIMDLHCHVWLPEGTIVLKRRSYNSERPTKPTPGSGIESSGDDRTSPKGRGKPMNSPCHRHGRRCVKFPEQCESQYASTKPGMHCAVYRATREFPNQTIL